MSSKNKDLEDSIFTFLAAFVIMCLIFLPVIKTITRSYQETVNLIEDQEFQEYLRLKNKYESNSNR